MHAMASPLRAPIQSIPSPAHMYSQSAMQLPAFSPAAPNGASVRDEPLIPMEDDSAAHAELVARAKQRVQTRTGKLAATLTLEGHALRDEHAQLLNTASTLDRALATVREEHVCILYCRLGRG